MFAEKGADEGKGECKSTQHERGKEKMILHGPEEMTVCTQLNG